MRTRLAAMVVASSLGGCLLLDPWDALTREGPSDASATDASDDATATEDGPPSTIDGGDANDPAPDSGTPAQWMYDRAVWLGSCTATRIAPRHLVTSLRCLPSATVDGGPVTATFYAFGPAPDPSRTATVIGVTSPPGTSFALGKFTASDGNFADLAVVELDRNVTFGVAATMRWNYPGSGARGQKVGVEKANGSSALGLLRYVPEATDSIADTNAAFDIRHAYDDIGGPFYINSGIQGVHSGRNGSLARFTSLPPHLPWILDAIRFRWPGGPDVVGRAFTGGVSDTFVGTERVCQYACSVVPSCLGYNHVASTSVCTLHASITGTSPSGGARSAVRWALRAGSARMGDPVGFLRGDGSSTVVHRHLAGGLGELRSVAPPAWSATEVTPTTANRPSAYVRSDGVDAIVYRDPASHVIERAYVGGSWVETDLTTTTSAPLAAGDPLGYLRVDGVSTVLYRSTSAHLVELSLGASWTLRDLTTFTGAPLAVSDPTAFDRVSQYTSISYRGSNNHIYEIYQDPSGAIGWGDPYGIAGLDLGATLAPYGYVRHDGVYAIVYRATDGTIRELAGLPAGWTRASLDVAGALPAASAPYAYVRSDGYSAVVYRSTTDRIIEISRGGTSSWTATDITVGVAAVPVGDPTAYVRGDGASAVLFRDAENHVWELTQTSTGWTATDLTSSAGETP